MAPSFDRPTRLTRDAANVAAAAVVVYVLLWILSTEVRSVRAISPFAEDPWDVFAGYAAIFLPVVAGATWIRSLRNRGPILPAATAQRIRWGSGLAAGIVLVASLADAEAIVTVGFIATAGISASVLTILVAASTLTAALAIVLSMRAAAATEGPEPAADPTEPDIIDDALVLVADVGDRIGLRRPVDRFAGAVERFLDRSSLSPRRHRWLFGVVLAILAAIAFDLWHSIREGPWINGEVALLFGSLVAAGVLAIYLATVVPLRLLRPPRPQPQPPS
jgi:hypothetical protein